MVKNLIKNQKFNRLLNLFISFFWQNRFFKKEISNFNKYSSYIVTVTQLLQITDKLPGVNHANFFFIFTTEFKCDPNLKVKC